MPRAFISYSRADDDGYVFRLDTYLRRYGIQSWYDRYIQFGVNWASALERAVQDSNVLIVIMTPRAADSEWVNRELDAAIRQDTPIYPLLRSGMPLVRIKHIQFCDVRDGNLPSGDYIADLVSRANPGVRADFMSRLIAAAKNNRQPDYSFAEVVHPEEILHAMMRECTSHLSNDGSGGFVAPSRYQVDLSIYDHARLASWIPLLRPLLVEDLTQFVQGRGWLLRWPVETTLTVDPSMDRAYFKVTVA
jgi:hypothetical protein